MKNIKNLPNQFIGIGEVKDSVFTKIKESDKAFIFEVNNGCSKNHYEVFRRKAKTNSVCYCYPTSKAFGYWAWCPSTLEKALEIFEELNNSLK
ncbi:hypothetical protein REB14_05065 [Chryseobacterium sp. ES2]|uniref:Uncharacterized protein n=1 Tax=Chryseobacterium metallicongregator TaxID=3073042 RepID=A0ABU1E1B5_9FLAO|nr:hypothetical protein [Chryseobacterium sp. ES2]MDR4951555.1 hypothetical protein [Chryseobacterium sp. ES2]